MAETSVVDKVVHRPAEGNKNVQIRYRPQYGTPDKRLPTNLPAKNGLSAGGAKCQLCQRIHRFSISAKGGDSIQSNSKGTLFLCCIIPHTHQQLYAPHRARINDVAVSVQNRT